MGINLLLYEIDIHNPNFDKLSAMLIAGLKRQYTILDIDYNGEKFIFQQPLNKADAEEQQELIERFVELVIKELQQNIKYCEEIMDEEARARASIYTWTAIYQLVSSLDDPHYCLETVKSEEHEVDASSMIVGDADYNTALLNDMVDQDKALSIKKEQWRAQGIPEQEIDAMVEFQGKIDPEMVKNQGII